ncbi:hypothetical protein CBE01nite_35080 [Clostridium beijerinckii]|nr:hypothetical protein CBE01nite_35080 [Clostridium beijerinckii]
MQLRSFTFIKSAQRNQDHFSLKKTQTEIKILPSKKHAYMKNFKAQLETYYA